MTGLNLLRLLAENKIAEFHTLLETIEDTGDELSRSGPVMFARGLEEWVMEGAYNRVWKAGEGKGVSVYQKFFLDVLMDTIRYNSLSLTSLHIPCYCPLFVCYFVFIARFMALRSCAWGLICRNEIATCLERAYPSLPISDTQILLFFPPQDHINFKSFAESVSNPPPDSAPSSPKSSSPKAPPPRLPFPKTLVRADM